MHQIANATELAGKDIIFIDDSNNAYDRSLTISAVLRRISALTLVAIHDFEVPQYQEAVAENNLALRNQFLFDALIPNTCVLWGECTVRKSSFAKLNKTIARLARDLLPDDVAGWIEALDNSRQFGRR
jgi:hypothetical protein